MWSGSAGAIYPLVRRLERRGLVSGRPHRRGQRESRLYSITRSGRERLRWIEEVLASYRDGEGA